MCLNCYKHTRAHTHAQGHAQVHEMGWSLVVQFKSTLNLIDWFLKESGFLLIRFLPLVSTTYERVLTAPLDLLPSWFDCILCSLNETVIFGIQQHFSTMLRKFFNYALVKWKEKYDGSSHSPLTWLNYPTQLMLTKDFINCMGRWV